MEKFKTLLKPLKRKMFFENFIKYEITGIILGSLLSLVLIISSKFIYINNMFSYVSLCILFGVLVGLTVTAFKNPTYEQVAKTSDKLGYKERFITALELLKTNKVDENSKLVILDAENKAVNLDKKYSITISKKLIYTLIAVLSAMFIVGFSPNYNSDEVLKRTELNKKIETEVKKIDKATELAKKELTAKKVKEIEEISKELKKDLKKSKNEGEAVKKIQKSQTLLMKLQNDSSSKDLKKLGETLKKFKTTEQLGKALEDGNLEEIRKNLENLSKWLENASDKEKEEFAKALEEAAKAISENKELKDATNKLSENIASGDNEELKNSLASLNSQISKTASENESVRKAVSKYNESLGNSSKEFTSSNQKINTNQENKSENASNPQAVAENGNNPNSEAKGNGSGGNGEKHGGTGRGKGHKENQNIYSREAKNKNDFEANVSGKETSSGSTEEKETYGMGEKGEMAPYDELLTKYKNEELKALDDKEIPYGVKELVKEYFSTLE